MNLTLLCSQKCKQLINGMFTLPVLCRQYGVTLIMISRLLTQYSCLHRWTGWRWRNA